MKRLLNVMLLAIAGAAAPGFAQGFPDKPVRLIVPYPPGGANDIVARLLAPSMAAELFNSLAGIKMLHVPYKGGNPAMLDLLGGRASHSTSIHPVPVRHPRGAGCGTGGGSAHLLAGARWRSAQEPATSPLAPETQEQFPVKAGVQDL